MFNTNPDALMLQAILSLLAGVGLYRLLKTSLGTRTSLMCVCAMFYYLFWLHFHPNNAYTNDIDGHMAYIHHMYGFGNPYRYTGSEHWHPPTYYLFAALWLHVCNFVTLINERTALRLFALILYLLYLVFALKTLRLLRQKEDLPYFLAALLISFWPLSILLATRITNDIMFYALWSAFYYYLSRWYKTWDLQDYQKAALLLGLGFIIKINTIILMAMLFCSVLYALRYHHVRLKQFFDRSLWFGYAMLISGFLIYLSRLIRAYLYNVPLPPSFGYGLTRPVSLDMLLDMRHYIKSPYLGNDRLYVSLDIPNFLLKYSLYSQFAWGNVELARVLNIVLLVFLLLMFANIVIGLIRGQYPNARLYNSLTSIGVPVSTIMLFYLLKNMGQCLDMRFIYPIIIPLVIMYMEGLLIVRSVPWGKPLYAVGVAVGLLLPSLGMLHYLSIYLIR